MPRSILLPLIVACALFMEGMDSSIIATSLPAIAAGLQESPIALKLALISYMVSLAVFIPISGWSADRFGARTVFASAIVVFVAGSILCAVSTSLGAFVAARFLQGMGGAMMVPVGRLILLRAVPKGELLRALMYLSMPALLGPVFGPPLGGLISTYFDWRWIFIINVPIGMIGLYLVLRHVPNLKRDELPDFDWIGFVLSGVGLAVLMLGLTTLGGHLIPVATALACIAIGALVLSGYYIHARRSAHPLINLGLIRISTFRAGIFGGGLLRISSGAIPFLLPLMLQLGFGLNPLESGLLTCVSAVGALFMKTLTQRILRTWGFRNVLIASALVSAIIAAIIGTFTAGTAHMLILLVLLLGGCFRSLQFTSINGLTYADIDDARMSHASSLSAMSQQLSLTMGVTVGAYALQISSGIRGAESIGITDFMSAFMVIGVVGLMSIISFSALRRDAGGEVSGYGK